MASSTNAKGKGRQKTIMQKIQNSSNLQVSFSKRRHGVVKKAHELSVLTGAEVASIVFSPGGKVYTYGHPTIDSVIHRFVTGIPLPLTLTQKIAQEERNVKVVQMNTELAKFHRGIEYEKNRMEGIKKYWAQCKINQVGNINWEEKNPAQKQQLIGVIKNTKAKTDREINAKVYAQQNNIPLEVGNVLLDSTGLEFSGNGGGMSFNAGSSSFFGRGGCLPNTSMGSSPGVGPSYLGLSFEGVPDQGLPHTYMASSSGVSGGDLGLSFNVFPNQLGQFVGPNTYVEGDPVVGVPKPYETSSSVVRNNNGGYGGFPNTDMAFSSEADSGGIGRSLDDFPDAQGEFLGPNYTNVTGGNANSFLG